MSLSFPPNDALALDVAAFECLDVPVAVTDLRGCLQWANVACLQSTGWVLPQIMGRPLDSLLGCAAQVPPAPWVAMIDGGHEFSGQPLSAYTADAQPLQGTLGMHRRGAHCVLTLQFDRPDVQASAQRLSLARAFGRIGFWSRDLRTGARHWDPEIWAIWGLPPQPGAPDFERTMQAVHADDREALRQAYAVTFAQCGRHGQRYRVRGFDGCLRHVHSEWHVRPGADGRPASVLGILRDDTETLQLTQSSDRAQEELRLAVDLAGIALWRMDLSTGWVQVNAQGWAVLGLAPRSTGLSMAEVRERLHPDDVAEVVNLTRQARATSASVDMGVRFRRPDGRWRYVVMRGSVSRVSDEHKGMFVGVSMDLTERFEQTQRSAELARRLDMATTTAGVAIWSHALATDEVHWNEQMRQLHGQPNTSLAPALQPYIDAHVHADDHDAVSQGLRTLALRRSGMLDLDFRVRRADGTVRRVASRTSVESAEGQATLYGVMLDVTDRYDAEARLREANERIAMATRGAGIGTWEYSAEGGFVWWDEQMLALRGMPPRAMPMPIDEALAMIHPEDRELAPRAIYRRLDEGQTANNEFRVVWPDGSVHWLASRSTTIRDAPGQPARRIGINWNITDVRAAAAERQERLLAQRENQAKSQFLARMSHELRTPLNAVLGFAHLLLTNGEGPGAQGDAQHRRQQLQHIQSAGQHLLGLINEVLDLSSLESGELLLQLRPVALGPLVTEVLPLVGSLALQRGVTLTRGALSLAVMADAKRLRQVLINLLSNAIKYNRAGGSVHLDAEIDGSVAVLRVRDTGRGMSPEQIRHLYEPFNRLGADRDGIEGTGIGLAIVRAAVQHMGGSLQVSSEPGIGTCFEVRLAAAELPPDIADHAPVRDSEALAQRPPAGRVLYIEDNPVNMLIVEELMLRRSDLQFHGAADGRSGVAQAQAVLPDLVLIDMQLPDIDGMAVLQRLREHPATAGLRCVALSANAMPGDIRSALDAGFADYWTKPLDFDAFGAELDLQFGPQTAAMRP